MSECIPAGCHKRGCVGKLNCRSAPIAGRERDKAGQVQEDREGRRAKAGRDAVALDGDDALRFRTSLGQRLVILTDFQSTELLTLFKRCSQLVGKDNFRFQAVTRPADEGQLDRLGDHHINGFVLTVPDAHRVGDQIECYERIEVARQLD